MNLRLERLSADHDRAAFSCGKHSIDEYLHNAARMAMKRMSAVTIVALQPHEPKRIVGFFTLAQHEFRGPELSDALRKKARVGSLSRVPGVLLAQLGVDAQFQGQGVGSFLLMHALRRSLTSATEIGAVAVVTDPVDAAAASFYRKYDFAPMEEEGERLVILMGTIAKAIGALSAPDTK